LSADNSVSCILRGENPFKGRIASEIDIKAKIARSMYYAEADFGRVTFEYSNNDGRYFIGFSSDLNMAPAPCSFLAAWTIRAVFNIQAKANANSKS
jgi:hypothetical protein